MSLQVLRTTSDLVHLASFVWLCYSLKKHQHCLGVSYRTQETLLLTYVLRYSYFDIVVKHTFRENVFKVLFVFFTLYCIYLIRRKMPTKFTYYADLDMLPHRYTIYPIALW